MLHIPDQLEALRRLTRPQCPRGDTGYAGGLAVDILPPSELGVGNAAQVVGYKVGMLLAGGVLVWASAWLGWSGAFLVMAALVTAVALMVTQVQEHADAVLTESEPTDSIGALLGALKRSLQTSGIGLALAVVGTYKMGESIIDVMYKPFLIDQGISASTLGLWLGTWGMGASVLGSVLGGLSPPGSNSFECCSSWGRCVYGPGQARLAAG